MFLTVAALLFQFPVFSTPQASPKPVPPTVTLSADASLSSVAFEPGRLVPEPIAPANPALAAPDPNPAAPIVAEPLPFVPVYAPMKVVSESTRRREWLALGIVEHGAAGFDAWSTRRVLSSMNNAQEENPFLRPFAGNASMYAAVQVTPAILDYVSWRMMNSRHGWMRHTWWLPQTVSAVVSLTSGVHNLGVYNSRSLQ